MLAFLGAICIPTGQAQEPTAAAATAAERAKLLEEQTRPQKRVPFNPKDFDKFAGYYQRSPEIPVFVHAFEVGTDMYLATFEHGQLECAISPLSPAGKVVGDFYHVLP